MAYKLLAEDEKSFKLSDGKGKSFTVAKQAISDALMQKIRGFADGGRVPDKNAKFDDIKVTETPVDKITITPEMMAQNPNQTEIEKLQIKQQQEQSRKALGKPTVDLSKLPAGSLELIKKGYTPDQILQASKPTENLKQDTTLVEQPIFDFKLPTLEKPEFALPQAAPTPQQTAPKLPFAEMPMGAIDVPQEMFSAIDLQRKAQEMQARETIKTYEEAEQKRAEADAIWREKYAELDRQNNALLEAASNNKIEPNRLFANASTGNKIAAAIGLILGGIGSGLTGQSNKALDILNKLVDNDIEAQKAQAANRATLYGMNLQKLRDEREAYNATKSQLASFVEGKLQQAAAKAALPAIQANALQAQAQIKQYRNALLQEMATKQATKAITQHVMKTGDQRFAEMLPEDTKKTLMPRIVPGFGVAPDADAAKKLRESVTMVKNINGLISNIKSISSKPYSDFSPEEKGKANVNLIMIRTTLGRLLSGGSLSDTEQQLMQELVADPTQVFEMTARKKLDQISANMNMRLNNELMSYGLQPRPKLSIGQVE